MYLNKSSAAIYKKNLRKSTTLNLNIYGERNQTKLVLAESYFCGPIGQQDSYIKYWPNFFITQNTG